MDYRLSINPSSPIIRGILRLSANSRYFYLVIPAQAGIQKFDERSRISGNEQSVGRMSEALSAVWQRMCILKRLPHHISPDLFFHVQSALSQQCRHSHPADNA
jgi:hypothetical protein